MSEDARGRMAEIEALMEQLKARSWPDWFDAKFKIERHVSWLLDQLRSAQAEVTRLRSLLDLPADCGLKTGNAPEITGKGIVWLKDYDELRADRHRMRAVVEAARALATEGRYIAGMADDNPFKGNGNRLADALAALDAAEGKRT